MATNVGSNPDRKPVWWALLSVNHTKKTCLIAYAVPILSIAIIAFSRQFAFDDPDGADFFIRNDQITRHHDARQAAREEYVFNSSQSVVERETRRLNFDLSILFRGKLPPAFQLPSDAEEKRSATNVLTRENLAALKQVEDEILNDAEYPSYCLFDEAEMDCGDRQLVCTPPLSLLNSPFLYGEWEGDRFCGRRNSDQPPSEEQFALFLNSLLETDSGGNVVVNPQYSELVGEDILMRTNSTWLMRSILRVGGPFRNYSSIEDRRAEQENQYIQWGLDRAEQIEALSTPQTDVTLTSTKLGNAAFSGIALRDLSFCVVAIALVFLIIWFHTGSGFLAVAAMGQVFFSFPLAYVIYRRMETVAGGPGRGGGRCDKDGLDVPTRGEGDDSDVGDDGGGVLRDGHLAHHAHQHAGRVGGAAGAGSVCAGDHGVPIGSDSVAPVLVAAGVRAVREEVGQRAQQHAVLLQVPARAMAEEKRPGRAALQLSGALFRRAVDQSHQPFPLRPGGCGAGVDGARHLRRDQAAAD
ncbi:hypothetical protein FGB62_252g015 [Gracilaria domingensis]|nr:hypothetical protein FGB62_252g015 [Gracilaria domingensis]